MQTHKNKTCEMSHIALHPKVVSADDNWSAKKFTNEKKELTVGTPLDPIDQSNSLNLAHNL